MRHNPLLTIAVTPQLGTGHEKETPLDIPMTRHILSVLFSVGILQNGCQLAILPRTIQHAQPTVGSVTIIGPVHHPVLENAKVLGKIQEQMIRRHGTTGKELTTHPSVFKVVGVARVRKNVDKQAARRFEKAGHLVQETLVVLHVFKHFHRHDQIIILNHIQGALVVGNIALWR